MATKTTIATEAPAATGIPDVDAWLAEREPDPEIERLAAALAEAEADVREARHRIDATRTRRAEVATRLLVLDDPSRPEVLSEAVLLDAESAALPPALREAERRKALALLALMERVADLADAEARDLVAATNAPIAGLDHATVRLAQANGYTGTGVAPDERIAEARADVERRQADLLPLYRRHERAVYVAGLARARVEATFGQGVDGFGGVRDGEAGVSWERAAERFAERAAKEAGR